ncbi:MAG: hypothetical protein AAF821_15900 [Cyanobacteria bacterium P01_D01_bin.156]
MHSIYRFDINVIQAPKPPTLVALNPQQCVGQEALNVEGQARDLPLREWLF